MKRRVRVKLSGCGTSIGKRLHVITFTLIKATGQTALKEITAYQFLARQRTMTIKHALEDIIREVSELNTIVVDGASCGITSGCRWMAVSSGIRRPLFSTRHGDCYSQHSGF